MRRSPLDEGLRWLRQADEDLHWARVLAEQAVELASEVVEYVRGRLGT